ncbi:MAG: tetratricopeptide repeat protein, partial [Methylococcaceae bacterium]
LVKAGGLGFTYDLADIGKQLVDYRSLMEHWDNVRFSKPILTLRYEDIVDDVEGAAQTLLAYIGVPWHPAVLDFQNLDRAVKTSSAWQIRQPIYRTSKAKWQHYAEFLGPLEAALNETAAPLEPAVPPLPQGLLQQGMKNLKAGQGKAAERIFQRMLDRNPGHAAAMHFLGMALFQQGSRLKALKRIKQSIALHPGHPAWYRNLALVLDALKLTDEAASAREKSRQMSAAHTMDLDSD